MPVLSSAELGAIHERVAHNAGGPRRPAIDFELCADGPAFGVVPLRALPAEWPTWAVSPAASGVGLCLPIDGAGHLGVATDRWGRVSWFAIGDDQSWDDAPPACQLLDDLCRIRLGLGSDPVGRGPDWFWLGQWLSEVIEVADRRTDTDELLIDVISVATAHPAVDPDEVAGLDVEGMVGFLVDRHREHVRLADWECVRLDALANPSHELHELAAALDIGAFSRWVSATLPPLSHLASTLTSRCSPLGLRLLGSVISDMVLRERVDL